VITDHNKYSLSITVMLLVVGNYLAVFSFFPMTF